MDIARWIIGTILCLFALRVACANIAALISSSRNRRRGIQRYHSQGFLVSPISGYLGLLTLPIEKSLGLWLLPLIDPSTWILILSVPTLVREYAQKDAPPNGKV